MALGVYLCLVVCIFLSLDVFGLFVFSVGYVLGILWWVCEFWLCILFVILLILWSCCSVCFVARFDCCWWFGSRFVLFDCLVWFVLMRVWFELLCMVVICFCVFFRCDSLGLTFWFVVFAYLWIGLLVYGRFMFVSLTTICCLFVT